MDVEVLIKTIIDCAYEVRKHLQQGFDEKVYKNALYLEMTSRGLSVETEVPFEVKYKDVVVGQYRADIIVEKSVILELKANNALCTANEVQLVNYLTALGIDCGLLINFGAERLEVKRKYRMFKPHPSNNMSLCHSV